jgi:hypothetical protein
MKNDVVDKENIKERHTVALSGDILKIAVEMQKFFAYDSPSKIINNCVKLGYNFFHKDPISFLKMIQMLTNQK